MGHSSLGTNKQTACIDALIKCTHFLALLEARHQCSLSTPPLAPRMFQAAPTPPTPMLHRKLWSLKQQCCICVAAALSSHNICNSALQSDMNTCASPRLRPLIAMTQQLLRSSPQLLDKTKNQYEKKDSTQAQTHKHASFGVFSTKPQVYIP